MKVPSWPYRKVINKLEQLGYSVVRQKGSHIRMRRDNISITVPANNPVARGTLHKILRDIQVDLKDFLKS
ncbi:MAG: hypothetical protein A2644_04465 [Candidatus Zambryskibacteria bacterium RIFCSPHIGHO2_01_FULL_39_63]|nr:MAG: hypothetical protein A2644_04465 [Candidatus Zambryskibacteria bacterium RIFCSPHIGHO2_01_FULL_39_63]OHA98235.1 MAG: hypothetical protein A3F20_04180 [Candidatus Zambryskibacteria bacterium RIFCSPHIGHO2_12_FULL_39_21]